MSARKRSPAALLALALVAAAALSYGSAPALASTPGQVLGTGFNAYGELGDGTAEARDSFAANPFLPPTAVEVSPGQDASLTLLANGAVDASGYNYYGELGDGAQYARYVPEAVPGLSGVTAVSEGGYQSLALLGNGTVAAWGRDDYGQLGNGEAVTTGCGCLTSLTLVDGVQGAGKLEGVVAIADGYLGADALLANGHVVTWGYGEHGDLGNGTTQKQSNVPVEVSGIGGAGKLENVVAVATGFYHSIALLSDGKVVTWGYNVYGELGDGSTRLSDVPVEVSGVDGAGKLEHVVAVSAGGDFDLALLSDGSVVAWGYNAYGELGNGSVKQSDFPVEVLGVHGTGTLGGVSSISANAYSALASTSDGTLVGWGENGSGELGDGSLEPASTPIVVPGVSGVVSLGHGNFSQDSLVIEGASAQLSTAGLDFAALAGAASAAQTVTLSNQGPAPLIVSGTVLSGSGFSKASDTCSGATLPAGASCSVAIAFAPGAPGGSSGALDFSTSAANAIPAVALSGTATSPPPPAAAPAPPLPQLSLISRKLHVRKGLARVLLACAGATCSGEAQLTARVLPTARHRRTRHAKGRGSTRPGRRGRRSQRHRARPGKALAAAAPAPRRRHAKRILLGRARYSVVAGGRATIELRLEHGAQQLLARARRHHARLRLRLSASVDGGEPVARILKLR